MLHSLCAVTMVSCAARAAPAEPHVCPFEGGHNSADKRTHSGEHHKVAKDNMGKIGPLQEAAAAGAAIGFATGARSHGVDRDLASCASIVHHSGLGPATVTASPPLLMMAAVRRCNINAQYIAVCRCTIMNSLQALQWCPMLLAAAARLTFMHEILS
jgi:hypothetical protein